MAVTAATKNELRILPTGHIAGAMKIAWGYGVLGSGTAEIVTGLKRVDAFWATGVKPATDQTLVLNADEAFPLSSGTVTVTGDIVVDGAADAAGTVVDGASSTFCWFAIGQ